MDGVMENIEEWRHGRFAIPNRRFGLERNGSEIMLRGCRTYQLF